MKKIFLILILFTALYLLPNFLSAQIVITSQEVKITPPLSISYSEFLSIGPLQSLLDLNNAENQTWDFSLIQYVDNSITKTVDTIPQNPAYSDASYTLPNTLTLGGINIFNYMYEKKDSSSITRLGLKIDTTYLDLGSGAFINLPAQIDDFTPKFIQVKFPLEYKPNIIDTIYSSVTVRGMTNVPQIGLDSANAKQKEEYKVINQTVGWGNLILGGFSNPMDVIVLKTTETIVDSIYFNGFPAPAAQLALLNIIQGAITIHKSIKFYTPGVPFEVLNFTRTINPDSTQSDGGYFYSVGNTTGVDNNNFQQINNSKVIPNPVKDNSFKISFNKDSEKDWKIKIYDNSGKLILNNEVINQSGNIEINLKFEINRMPGNYNYLIIDGGGLVKYSGKFIVE